MKTSEDKAGKKGTCPKCGERVQVPTAFETNKKQGQVASQGSLAELASQVDATRPMRNDIGKPRQTTRRSPQQRIRPGGYSQNTKIVFVVMGLVIVGLTSFILLRDSWDTQGAKRSSEDPANEDVTNEDAAKDELAGRKNQETQAFLKAARPFARQAARITSLYRTGLSYNSYSRELGELRVAYDQAMKAPNSECSMAATFMDEYMFAAQNLGNCWGFKVRGDDMMEIELRRQGNLPSDLLPKLCSKQEGVANWIAALEGKSK